MATFESTGTGTTGASSYTLRLVVNEDSYSIANNTSSVSWALYLISTGYDFADWSFPITANVDGEVYNESTSRSINTNSTITIASGSKTISHSTDGKKTISCSASLSATAASYLPGNISVSGTLKLTDIPRYATATQSLKSKFINSITMNWSSDSIIDYIWYSTNNGTSWKSVGSVNASSGSYTISDLNPNTTYSIKTRVRRKDSQLTTDSTVLSVATYDIAKISSASNFNLGDNASVIITNPASTTTVLVMKIGTTQVLSQNLVTGANTISFTDEQLDSIYKKFATSNSVTITYTLITNSNSSWTNTQDVICMLTGNQKTGHININGSWKRTKRWINVNGTWKKCVKWINVNGIWKRCI